MVAGGFCARGLTKLHIVEPKKTVNADYYREKILPVYLEAMRERTLFPNPKKFILMQDGATCHTSKQNMAFIRASGIGLWETRWPGNSPDLNPIENLWSILKESAYKEPKPKTREELITRFQKSWKNLSPGLLEKSAQSFKDRVEKMMAADGGHTKY